jgi:hypothetical protein
MGASHLLVETNWVVACYAPAHLKASAALELLKKATEGALVPHVPGICLSEARATIRRKSQPRSHLDPVRAYLRWAKDRNRVATGADETVRRVLDSYENEVLNDLEGLEESIASLRREKGVDVFALTEEMLERALVLGIEQLELQPFDLSILAAILTRASEIKKADPEAEVFFCELDTDLQPWDRDGNSKQNLSKLYEEAHLWVYSDFAMTSRRSPAGWAK